MEDVRRRKLQVVREEGVPKLDRTHSSRNRLLGFHSVVVCLSLLALRAGLWQVENKVVLGSDWRGLALCGRSLVVLGRRRCNGAAGSVRA